MLESPQHLEQLLPLLDAFPDATIAITHRDPVSVIRPAITMIAGPGTTTMATTLARAGGSLRRVDATRCRRARMSATPSSVRVRREDAEE